jgi:hypothetical protein
MAHAILLPTEQEPLKTHPKLTFEKNGYSYVVERHGDSSTYTVRNGKGEELVLSQIAMSEQDEQGADSTVTRRCQISDE